MAKTFAQEFTEACERLDKKNTHLQMEIGRVHQETIRDGNHAYSQVEIMRPDPWKHGSGLTI